MNIKEQKKLFKSKVYRAQTYLLVAAIFELISLVMIGFIIGTYFISLNWNAPENFYYITYPAVILALSWIVKTVLLFFGLRTTLAFKIIGEKYKVFVKPDPHTTGIFAFVLPFVTLYTWLQSWILKDRCAHILTKFQW